MTKQALLVLDGLPSSSQANILIEKMAKHYDVFYCSFVTDLSHLHPSTIENHLEQSIIESLKNHKEVVIVAVSFGAYILVHSNNLLSKYETKIDRIVLYSPVAKLSLVVGIATLPVFLNKKYNNARVSTNDFTLLDTYFGRHGLLGESLREKTTIVLGIRDNQLPIEQHQLYFDGYTIIRRDEGHMGIGFLINQDKLK